MVTKLDIMNKRDEEEVAPGEVLPWQIVKGKIQKEIRVTGPTVKEGIKEILIIEKPSTKKKKVKK